MERIRFILVVFCLSGSIAAAQTPNRSPLGIPVPVPPGTTGVPETVLSIPGVSGTGIAPVAPQRMPSSPPPNAVVQPSVPMPPAAIAPPIDEGIAPSVVASPIADDFDFWGADCGNRLWGSAEYLLWWMKKGSLAAPLLTAGASGDPTPGAIGQTGTTTLLGGSGLNYRQFSGLRLTAGAWLDRDRQYGIEVGGFALLQNTESFSASGNGDRILGRPFVNAATGAERAFAVSGPGLAGNFNFSTTSRLWSADANGLYRLHQGSWLDVVLLGGFRTLDLTESLQIDQNERSLTSAGGLTFGGGPVGIGNAVAVRDRFGAENRFYGGQTGVRFRVQQDIFFLDMTTKIAIGVTREQATIDGSTTLNGAGGNVVDRGGFLASGSNLGSYARDRLAFVPEGNLQLGAQVRPWLVIRFGYNFTYWSNVVRPGDAIDRTINSSRVPSSSAFGGADPSARPAFGFASSSFWVQGMTVGLEVRY